MIDEITDTVNKYNTPDLKIDFAEIDIASLAEYTYGAFTGVLDPKQEALYNDQQGNEVSLLIHNSIERISAYVNNGIPKNSVGKTKEIKIIDFENNSLPIDLARLSSLFKASREGSFNPNDFSKIFHALYKKYNSTPKSPTDSEKFLRLFGQLLENINLHYKNKFEG